MSAETFSYKGISAGKYIEGEIEASISPSIYLPAEIPLYEKVSADILNP